MKICLGLSAACLAASLASAQTAPAPPAPAPAPAPQARSAQAMVIQHGGGYLGIGGMDVSADKAKSLGLKEEAGVLISTMAEDGPAAKAGIKEGDVVIEFNGMRVQSAAQFQRMVGETPPGRQAKITVWRNGAAQTLTATIGEKKNMVTAVIPDDGRAWGMDMPGMPRMPEMNMPRFEAIMPAPALGIYGEPLGENDQLAEFFGVTDGVLVRSVRKGSAAEKAGIKAGDVITKVDESHISASGDITRALRGVRGKKSSVVVMVVRNKKETPITVTIESANVGALWELFRALNG